MQWKTILVPMDFSEDSEAALGAAVEFAKTTGARLILLHAFEFPTYIGTPWGFSFPPGAFSEARVRASELLAERNEKVLAEGVQSTTEAREGPPSEVIVEVAESLSADLIVMGTRGLTGIKHVLLGSTAERTLRYAPCPVMTVKAPS